jgi:PAS domain-containing protein
MWGRTQAQTLNKPLFEALPELAGQGFEDLLLGVYTTGVPFIGKELPGELLRDGRRETLYFDFIYLPIRDEAEQITGITVVATDATAQVLARQRAERELRESRQREEAAYAKARLERDRLRALFMQAPVGIGIYSGTEHRVELVNPFMSSILGRPAEALLDKPLFEALPEVRGQGFEAILAGVLATGTPFEANEIAATLERDGELVPGFYNTVYQALKDERGQVTGYYPDRGGSDCAGNGPAGRRRECPAVPHPARIGAPNGLDGHDRRRDGLLQCAVVRLHRAAPGRSAGSGLAGSNTPR